MTSQSPAQSTPTIDDIRSDSGKGLRIKSVEAFTLRVQTKPGSTAWTFARVTTEEGIVGLGEGIGTPAPICAGGPLGDRVARPQPRR